MKVVRRCLWCFSILQVSFLACTQAFGSAPVKVIEWGWNTPSPTFVKEHIGEMEKMPFDGLVLDLRSNVPKSGCKSLFSWNSWSSDAIDIRDYSDSFAALKYTEFGRFTDNFIRFNVVPGDVDWFDEQFSSVISNALLAGKIAKSCNLKGILLDVEQYEGSPFNYLSRPGRLSHSFAQYQVQVEKCGRDFMMALANEYPQITILLTYGYYLAGRDGGKPESREYGLLTSFLDGMIKAAPAHAIVIDGWEYSYGYKTENEFRYARDIIYKERETREGMNEDRRSHYQCSFGLFLDHMQHWDPNDFNRNYFSPEEFSNSVGLAMKYSDHYVWVYSQKPNWWNSTMPQAYVDALNKAKSILSDNK